MIPLHDDNPTRTTPVLTIALIVINVLVFLWQLAVGLDVSTFRFGLIPSELLGSEASMEVFRKIGVSPRVLGANYDPAWVTILTSMFLHGGWMHVIGNMWFLWIFGNNVEDELGKVKFILFYLVCGIAAAMAQVFISTDSPIPMVGASGAVAGVLGAYIVLHPHSRIYCLVILLVFITTMNLPAWVVLGYWFLLELLRGVVSFGPQAATGGVAYGAHVGGFAAGWLLVRLLRGGPPRREPLREYYDRPENTEWR